MNKVSHSSSCSLSNLSSISNCCTSSIDGVHKTTVKRTVHGKVQKKDSRGPSGRSSEGDATVSSQHRMNRLSRIGKDDRSDSLILIDNGECAKVEFEDPWVPMKGKPNKQYRDYDLLASDDTSESTNSHLLEVPLMPELSADEKDDINSHPSYQVRSYKRRYWMLFIFSLVGFAQYCGWNTYGPIATTAKAVFNWSNTEIAILASMDPIMYLFTMVFFSWMMDVKGLRNSMLVSTAFMFVGTGLRCVTSDPKYAIWSMGGGQLLNGLAGPVTQAGPPLLSAYWFPPHQRTTATAVAALCGSFGVAMSFLIGPAFVTDVKTELDALMPKPLNQSANISLLLERYSDTSLPLQDSVYLDAQHYWSLDELNITLIDTPVVSARDSIYFPPTSIPFVRLAHPKRNRRSSPSFWQTEVMTEVRDLKSAEKGLAFGRVQVVNGVVNDSVLTNGQDAWLKLGHFINTCLGEPALCQDGLTVSFWIKYHKLNRPLQYFMGTSGTKEGYRGFLVYQDFRRDTEDHLTIKVENSTSLWERSFFAPRDTWVHVMFTWDSKDGLSIYSNGSLSGKDVIARTTKPLSPYFTTLTVGRPNDEFVFCNASFDEVAVWYRKLHPLEIEKIYKRLNGKEIRDEWEFYEKAKVELIKEGEDQIMTLLYIEFAIVTVLFLAVVIYFPDKPPRPPSYSAKIKREDFSTGVRQIFKNPQFWTLGLVYGVTTGIYSGWGASLAVNLETFNISQSDAAWLGFYATIAGTGAGLILARCADLFGGRMKALLVCLFFGSSGCFLWFALLCLRMIPFDNDSLYKSSILGGFFVSGTIPLFYELTVETTYPVAEGVTTGLLTLINNTFTVIFLLVLTIPGVGTVWMNWCMFGACAACIPIMLSFREKYRRLDIDRGKKQNSKQTEKESTKSKKAVNSPSRSPSPSPPDDNDNKTTSYSKS